MQKITLTEGDREKLLLSFLPLVRRIAARIVIPSPGVVDKEDLISQGILALIEAFDRFDSTREVSFESYVYHRVRGAMIDSIRAISFSPRSVNDRVKQFRAVEDSLRSQGLEVTEERMAEEMKLSRTQVRDVLAHISLRSLISLDKVLLTDEGEEATIAETVQSTTSPNPVQVFEDRELHNRLESALGKLATRDRNLLNLYYVEDLTFKEIAAVFEVTEGRVSQLHGRAIMKLRQFINESN